MIPEAARLAARQHALITIGQLGQYGITQDQVRHRIDTGVLVRVRRGVYRVAGTPLTWEQAVLASVLAAGDGAVASHATAAALWALKHSDRHRAGLHVTAVRQLRLAGVTAHVRPVPRGSTATYLGIPVTSPEQTIVDLAGTLSATRLGECVDDADRRHLIKLRRLRELIDTKGTRGRRPSKALRRVLGDRPAGYQPGASDWERQMDRMWDELGLPAATSHYKVLAGGRRYEIDRAIPELKIGVEWNGYEYHGSRSAFDYDSDRRADLTAEGWHMIDFTSNSTPRRIVGAVLRAVDARIAPPGQPAQPGPPGQPAQPGQPGQPAQPALRRGDRYDPGTEETDARRQRR